MNVYNTQRKTCTHCGYEFTRKSALTLHLKNNTCRKHLRDENVYDADIEMADNSAPVISENNFIMEDPSELASYSYEEEEDADDEDEDGMERTVSIQEVFGAPLSDDSDSDYDDFYSNYHVSEPEESDNDGITSDVSK